MQEGPWGKDWRRSGCGRTDALAVLRPRLRLRITSLERLDDDGAPVGGHEEGCGGRCASVSVLCLRAHSVGGLGGKCWGRGGRQCNVDVAQPLRQRSKWCQVHKRQRVGGMCLPMYYVYALNLGQCFMPQNVASHPVERCSGTWVGSVPSREQHALIPVIILPSLAHI